MLFPGAGSSAISVVMPHLPFNRILTFLAGRYWWGVVIVWQRHCLMLFDPVDEVGVVGVWYRVVDCSDIVDGVEHGWLPSRYAADPVKTAGG